MIKCGKQRTERPTYNTWIEIKKLKIKDLASD